ncbi:MAG: hybrid sensor histidine kinase/response regulator [Dehalococcoidia bacterium]|nr:hybrid sensor histidine kinase/response regulator [Dehalococcoidia bacterium]
MHRIRTHQLMERDLTAMSILVVDDFQGARLMLESVLKSAGHSDVLCAGSGEEAFTILGLENPTGNSGRVNSILMDVGMPGVDGFEACRRIKAAPWLKDIPILMVTGLEDPASLEAAFAAGAVDYITKPLNQVELLARVRSALDLKREMDQRKLIHVTDLEAKNQELQLAYGQLEAQNRELERASLAKTQILSTATHELKTPLTSIVGYVDRMLFQQGTVGALNEKQQKYMETVQKNAHRLKTLVDDLLDVSRIEAGTLELKLVDMEVQQEVEEVVQSMQNQVQAKQSQIVLSFPPDLGAIQGDRLRFSQVITNLLSNAIKYSSPCATVTVTARETGNGITVEVADTGMGISLADQAKLFTKFFRVDNSTTRQESGTGLGLYLTRHLVEAHGGSIRVESETGKGTTVSFTWPKTHASGAQAAPSAGREPAAQR